MTTCPKTRDLARCLLNYEAVSAKSPGPMENAAHSVYEKLRQSLSELWGVEAFESLAFRALALARREAPSVGAVPVSADGALQGLGQIENQFDIDKIRAGELPAGEGGVIFVAQLLGLLLIFLGEPLTISLLRVAWPRAAFDVHSSENGRKA